MTDIDSDGEYDPEAYEAALEQARQIEADGCLKMFRGVCLPVLAATVGFGSIGLWEQSIVEYLNVAANQLSGLLPTNTNANLQET